MKRISNEIGNWKEFTKSNMKWTDVSHIFNNVVYRGIIGNLSSLPQNLISDTNMLLLIRGHKRQKDGRRV